MLWITTIEALPNKLFAILTGTILEVLNNDIRTDWKRAGKMPQ